MIREATPDDLPEIHRMGRAFAEACGIGVAYDEETAEITANQLMSDETGVLLIGDGGMVGGLVYPHYFNYGVLVAQELFWWVDEDRRGSGLGVALFKRFEKWAGSVGASYVFMISLASQKPVGRLYERRGYSALETTHMRAL